MLEMKLLSMAVSLGSACGARAEITLLVLAVLGRLGCIDLPASLSWIESTTALGGLAALALLESLTERDEDMYELLALLHYGTRGACGWFVALAAVHTDANLPPWALGFIGAAVAIGTHALRVRLHELLQDFELDIVSPRLWLLRLEEGGVIGVCVAAILAPYIALSIIIATTAAGFAAQRLAAHLEHRRRLRLAVKRGGQFALVHLMMTAVRSSSVGAPLLKFVRAFCNAARISAAGDWQWSVMICMTSGVPNGVSV
jgi:hypothetical protein